ncbi:MAG: dethiobiotin synthase [Alphaproteobacteria bacterium]|nr:dethiobiotin synthase [Alphaproteobacteria bacterium]
MLKNKAIFIVGTGTNVGKTYASAVLVNTLRFQGINAGYYKAVSSGNERFHGYLTSIDADFVKKFANLDEPTSDMWSYAYEEEMSPHLAARYCGNFVNNDVIRRDFNSRFNRYEFIVVEGCGGIICPLKYEKEKSIWLEDIIIMLNLPIAVVADAGVGTINSTCLTISYLQQKNINISGVILNNFEKNNPIHEDNCFMIYEKANVPIIGTISKYQQILDSDLSSIL